MFQLIETIIGFLVVFGIITAPFWFLIIMFWLMIKADKEE
jgi:hypothetical protein